MEYQTRPRKNSFATASMFLGIFALFTISTVFLPIILGALSILFGVLAHRKGQKLDIPSLTGFISSAVALVMTVFTIVSAFKMLPTLLNDESFRDQLNYFSEQLYGESFDEMLEYAGGMDLDEIIENY